MQRIYAPRVKAKEGEVVGLAHVRPDVVDATTPIFELVAPEFDPKTGERKRSDRDECRRQVRRIPRAWANGRPCYIDPIRLTMRASVWQWIQEDLTGSGVNWAPVAYPLASEMMPASLVSVAKQKNRIALRVSVNGLLTSEGLRKRCESVGVDPKRTLFLLDGGNVTPEQTAVVALGVAGILDLLPFHFGQQVLSFTAFPQFISHFEKQEISVVARCCWHTFVAAAATFPDEEWGFSDSLTTGPHPERGERVSGPIPNLRYTDEQAWFVARGKSRKAPAEQYIAICDAITKHPAFRPDYSWGESEIKRVANGEASLASSWSRSVESCLHATFVSEQLSSLAAA